MGERNLWTKLGLIVLIVGLSAWQVWPPGQKLKPGIDLGGGHSLLFEIDDTGIPEYQRSGLAEQVMTILKQRVDPGSTRNLVWRPIGWNRLEIQMPQPTKEQSKYRDAYEKARSALTDKNITEAQIRSALTLPPAQRQAAFDAMVRGISARKPLFEKLAQAEDDYRRLQAQATQPASGPASAPATRAAATQPISSELAARIDAAFLARRSAVEELIKTNLDIRVLGDILALDLKSKIRTERLRKLEDEHPDLKAQIDQMVATYDEWSKYRGALDDPSDLLRLLRGAGKLEFRILAQKDPANPGRTLSNNPKYREEVKRYIDQLAKFGPRLREGDNFQWFKISKPEESDITKGPYIVEDYLGTKYVLSHSTDDMGLINKGDNAWQLRGAYEGMDRTGRPAVHFELDARGGAIFGELTRNSIHRPLCIFLDNEAMSSATIQSEITTSGQITGNFSRQDVARIINVLNAGVLPARLKETPLQQKSVGPGLGSTNRDRGLRALLYAVIVTVAFMAVYYSYNGVIADIAVLLNVVITLGVLSFIQATFTLPGLAGLVLTLGMAVDANVLIYERMREELDRGVSLRMAVKLGYERAFSAILDSNVTTILTAIILVAIGSEEIKGFGLTLAIGLTISMFTALFVTRQYFNVMTPPSLDSQEMRKTWLSTLVLALVGGAFLGLGYVFNATPRMRDESALFGIGRFFAVMFATAFLLLVSMYCFRIMFRVLGHQKAGRMPMLRFMSAPNINWMGWYKVFWCGSALVIGLGMLFVTLVPKNDVLDIEFLGGTSVQIQLKSAKADQFKEKGDEKLLEYVKGRTAADENNPRTSVGWLRWSADQIRGAKVTPQGYDSFLVSGLDKRLAFSQIGTLLMSTLGDYVMKNGITQKDDGALVQFKSDKVKDFITDAASAQAFIRRAAGYLDTAADRLRNTRVQLVQEETAAKQTRAAFELITTETQSDLVADALRATMGDILEVTQPIDAKLATSPDRAPDGMYPIKQSDNMLSDVIGGDVTDSIADFKGGVALVFDQLNPPATASEITQRLKDMRLQPDFEDIGGRENVRVIPLDSLPSAVPGGEARLKRFALAVSDPNMLYVEGEDNSKWRSDVAEKELALAKAALGSSRSLQRVTQFAPQVAGEAVQGAVIAVILALIAIAVYLWVRFGSVDFGLAGIISLYHDVAVTLGCYIACHYIYNTVVGRFLLIEDFKVNLNLIAALLTIIGFSINDTIVIFDRIRENRGRMPTFTPKLINDSINQCLSRTVITTLTVFLTVVILYFVGGEGIHDFAFAMLVGTITGVYSTLAIATPMVQHPRIMWVTTIALAALTTALIVSMLGFGLTVKIVLTVLIGLVSLWALVRQWKATAVGGIVREAPAAA